MKIFPSPDFMLIQNFWSFFHYELLHGSEETALDEPFSTVLTEETALKLFDRIGMVSYNIQLKLKEVSIRKILGASIPELIATLSKGFVILLTIAIVIAIPVAWFLNDLWLQHITVRVNMSAEIIFLGVGIIVLFGLVTIGSQTLRASLLDPVKFLKDE